MGILTFKGGVHPYDGKELSKNSPVVKYLPKGYIMGLIGPNGSGKTTTIKLILKMCIRDRMPGAPGPEGGKVGT